MEIFSAATVNARREKVQKKFDSVLKNDELVVIFCGSPIQKPGGLDQTYPFIPHPDYFWLTGSRRALGVLAYSKSAGWIDFIQHVTRDEKLWEGSEETSETKKGLDISQFESWFQKQNASKTLCLGQPSQKQKMLEKNVDIEFHSQIQEGLNQVRRAKDASEVELQSCTDGSSRLFSAQENHQTRNFGKTNPN
jgi:Xaa-Pro dipeptidase